MRKRIRQILVFIITTIVISSCSKPHDLDLTRVSIGNVKWWMCQTYDLQTSGALAKLAKSNYEMLVLEPGDNYITNSIDIKYIPENLHYTTLGKKRLLLAYVNIGEAESDRTYWQGGWIAPAKTTQGTPNFLLTIDPNGWSAKYPVAFWHNDWKNIWIGSAGRIAKLAEAGWDGVYLDWVSAYDNENVRKQAAEEGISTEKAMMDFIESMRTAAKVVNPNFKIVIQNAPCLIDYDTKRYVSLIDAVSMESTWYTGMCLATWSDPLAGDIAGKNEYSQTSDVLVKQYQKFLNYKIPVFTIDYCIDRENADGVYEEAQSLGFKPLVTRVSLSKITETPPSDLH